MKKKTLIKALAIGFSLSSTMAYASNKCPVSYDALTDALKSQVSSTTALGGPTGGTSGETNGGFDFDMWATVVEPDGTVCVVTKTGAGRNDQWLGSRVISSQKANTAIAFSKPDLAISTANLFSAVQPGGSLFGLQHSNPVNTNVSYRGNSKRYGTKNDPMNRRKVGGVNVFGGGLALYDAAGKLVGALGVSGDTSCADHNVAWRVRDALGLDNVPAGPGGVFGGTIGDNIVFDIAANPNGGTGVSASGFGHPTCGGPTGDADDAVDNANIISTRPLGP